MLYKSAMRAKKEDKTSKKALTLTLCVMLIAILLAGCNTSKLTIQNIDTYANTFDLVDSSTGDVIQYDTLICNGEPVLACYGIRAAGVAGGAMAFITDEAQINDDGSANLSGATAYKSGAEFKYKLDDGVLKITR